MNDRGAATIYAAGAGLFLMLAGLAVTLKAGDLVTAAQAQTAADLSALAGAARATSGETYACARANDIASRNGASVAACSLHGWDLTVTVRIGAITASAKAGPVRG